MSTERPLLLIDVDGVLNPYVQRADLEPQGFARHVLGGQDVILNPEHGVWMHELSRSFDLAWATTWGDEANALIGPVIGAPQDMPTIAFTELDSLGWTWKLPAVEAFVGQRPVAWLDDDPGEGADAWVARRTVPTTLIRPIPHLGWTSEETGHLMEFASRVENGS